MKWREDRKYLIAWIVLMCCVLCSGYCFAQGDSSTALRWTKLKVQSLQNQHIDTILCYNNECGGCFHKKSKDSCYAYDDMRYLFWHKKSRYFACVVDKCGSHKIAPIDERSWAVLMDDYATIVKLNPADTYKEKTSSGKSEMTVFGSGDDIPEDIFELYLTSGHVQLHIDDYYLDSPTRNAEKTDDQTVKKIKEIKATIKGVMETYLK